MKSKKSIKTRIISYLDGGLEGEELKELSDWIEQSKENARFFSEVKDLWEASLADASRIADTAGEWNKFLIKIGKKSNRKRVKVQAVWNWWQKAAAILIIPLIVASYVLVQSQYGILSSESGTIKSIVPMGQKSQLMLADGTSVWLNSGSELEYSLTFGRKERRVILSGEAFFDVKKNKNRPFIVETDNYDIEVTGTRFNVQTYRNSEECETVLEEGAVIIRTTKGQKVNLEPGQRIHRAKSGKYRLSNVDPTLYSCWKENVLKINSESLERLIVRMERWYGVRIRVEDLEKVKNLRYTLTIKTESLREMLSLLNVATPLKYKINGDNVTLKFENN